MVIAKVPGLNNPAKIVTEYLNAEAAQRHFSKLHITRSGGRAQSAPTLAAMRGRAIDEWAEEAEKGDVRRVHHGPRRSFFTPVRVKEAPTARALAKARSTVEQFLSNGKKFRIVDNWTTKGTAHHDLGGEWIGTTKFLVLSGGTH